MYLFYAQKIQNSCGISKPEIASWLPVGTNRGAILTFTPASLNSEFAILEGLMNINPYTDWFGLLWSLTTQIVKCACKCDRRGTLLGCVTVPKLTVGLCFLTGVECWGPPPQRRGCSVSDYLSNPANFTGTLFSAELTQLATSFSLR